MTATAITSLGEVTEVPEKASRRTYTVDYKLKIVKEADACKGTGDIGALLRGEGLYSSQLTTWRQARDRGELAPGAAAKKRGPKATPVDPRDKKSADLERQIAKITTRAERAEAIAEIQKAGSAVWASVPERGIVMETVALHGPPLGVGRLCRALAVARATYYRHLEAKAPLPRPTPARALTVEERISVLGVLHEPRFADQAPAEVFARLLDEDRYLCSERTMYRILADNAEVESDAISCGIRPTRNRNCSAERRTRCGAGS